MSYYVDDGVCGYYVNDDLQWSHICENCDEIFETTIPLPSEEARFCADCYFGAIEVIQLWWRKRLNYKKENEF